MIKTVLYWTKFVVCIKIPEAEPSGILLLFL